MKSWDMAIQEINHEKYLEMLILDIFKSGRGILLENKEEAQILMNALNRNNIEVLHSCRDEILECFDKGAEYLTVLPYDEDFDSEIVMVMYVRNKSTDIVPMKDVLKRMEIKCK